MLAEEPTEADEVLKNKTYHFSSSDLVNVGVGVCLSLLPLPRLETGSHYVAPWLPGAHYAD